MRYSLIIFFAFLLMSCGKYQAVSEQNNFSINFPMKFEQRILGSGASAVELFYAFSPDSLTQYQVAVNQIDPEEKGIPSDTIFKYRIMQPAAQLGIMSMERENFDIEGHPAMRFTLLGINAASIYDMYLIEDKLYHICIIDKHPRKPTEEEVKAFMGSFELKK